MSALGSNEKTFRDIFKKYKRRDVPLDTSEVVNFNDSSAQNDKVFLPS